MDRVLCTTRRLRESSVLAMMLPEQEPKPLSMASTLLNCSPLAICALVLGLTLPPMAVANLGTVRPPPHHATTQADLDFSEGLARLNEVEGVMLFIFLMLRRVPTGILLASPLASAALLHLTQWARQSPGNDPYYARGSLFLVEETVDDATIDQAGDVSDTGITSNNDFPTSEAYNTVFETEATYDGCETSIF